MIVKQKAPGGAKGGGSATRGGGGMGGGAVPRSNRAADGGRGPTKGQKGQNVVRLPALPLLPPQRTHAAPEVMAVAAHRHTPATLPAVMAKYTAILTPTAEMGLPSQAKGTGHDRAVRSWVVRRAGRVGAMAWHRAWGMA